MNIEDINGIDRWAAGKSSERISSISDIPFGASFAAPVAMLIDGDINDYTGQVLLLYLESLATTATLYTMTVGIVNRSRPYVYDDSGETSMSRRLSANGQRSFFAGHVAASATGTFFAAKIYNDFHPDSPAVPWVWAGAATIPAAVAYLRIEAGQHFLTDVTVGYVIGAAVGILVPELHKKKNRKLDISPTSGINATGNQYTGLSLRYQF